MFFSFIVRVLFTIDLVTRHCITPLFDHTHLIFYANQPLPLGSTTLIGNVAVTLLLCVGKGPTPKRIVSALIKKSWKALGRTQLTE